MMIRQLKLWRSILKIEIRKFPNPGPLDTAMTDDPRVWRYSDTAGARAPDEMCNASENTKP